MKISPFSYLKKLQEFPHRGLGTDYAHKAADLIADEYKACGLKTTKTSYKSYCYSWIFDGLFCVCFLAASLFLFLDNFLAAIFSIVFIFPLVILNRYGNKILPKPRTANDVFAEILPRGKVLKTVVVLGHYDTAKQTLALKIAQFANHTRGGRKLLSSFAHHPFFLRSPFLPAYIALIFWLAAFILKLIFGFTVIFLLLNGVAFIFFSIMTVLLVLPVFAPYVPGAFDNGSGAATVMSLAPYFAEEKLRNTRLILWNDGAEEGGFNGFDVFFKTAKIDLCSTIFINLDGVGADKLYAVYGEADSGFGFMAYYDQDLFKEVEEIESTHHYKHPVRKHILQVATDSFGLCKRGCRVMTTFTSLKANGYFPDYHQMTDTIEHVNPKTMELCRDFIIALLKKIDKDPV